MTWQAILKTSLLGTDNTSLGPDALAALQGLGIDVGQEQPAVLANAAAALAQFRKAGFQLETYEGHLPTQDADLAENPCSDRSTEQLQFILRHEFGQLLPEFLDIMLSKGKHFPSKLLPTMLGRPDLAKHWLVLRPCLGPKCRWLMLQHPVWRNMLVEEIPGNWDTGSRAERTALLRQVHRQDPPEALALLQSTWAAEDYRDKTAFLALLEQGLSPLDEPFLEKCVDEKRKEVRLEAIRLLTKIKGSRMSSRQYQRAVECLGWASGHLSIVLPEEPGTEALRDGLVKISPQWKGGPKAAYLGQVLAVVPPSLWEPYFQQTPEAILALFEQSDWAATLLEAVAKAAVLFGDQDWATAILGQALGKAPNQAMEDWMTDELLLMVPAAGFNRLALSAMNKFTGLPEQPSLLFRLLKTSTAPWEDALSLLLAHRLREQLNSPIFTFRQIYQKEFFEIIAVRSSPALAERLRSGWNTGAPQWGYWEKALEQMLLTLQLREAMREALSL